jgi:hypothetical protein
MLCQPPDAARDDSVAVDDPLDAQALARRERRDRRQAAEPLPAPGGDGGGDRMLGGILYCPGRSGQVHSLEHQGIDGDDEA